MKCEVRKKAVKGFSGKYFVQREFQMGLKFLFVIQVSENEKKNI